MTSWDWRGEEPCTCLFLAHRTHCVLGPPAATGFEVVGGGEVCVCVWGGGKNSESEMIPIRILIDIVQKSTNPEQGIFL